MIDTAWQERYAVNAFVVIYHIVLHESNIYVERQCRGKL